MRLPRPHPSFPPHQLASSATSSSRCLSAPPARRTVETPNHHPLFPLKTSALRRATPAGMPRPPHRENACAGKDRHLLPKRDSRALSSPFRCNRPIVGTCVEHRPIVRRPHPGVRRHACGCNNAISAPPLPMAMAPHHLRCLAHSRPALVSVVHQPLQHPWRATFTPCSSVARQPVPKHLRILAHPLRHVTIHRGLNSIRTGKYGRPRVSCRGSAPGAVHAERVRMAGLAQRRCKKYADGGLTPVEDLGVLCVQQLSGLRFRRRRFARRAICPSRTGRESAPR